MAANSAALSRVLQEVLVPGSVEAAYDSSPRSRKLPAGEASQASVTPGNLNVNTFKGAEDGQGLIARVYEIAGKAADGTLTLPWLNIASANEASAVEVNGKRLESDVHNLRFHTEPHRVMTIRVVIQ